VGRRIGGHLLEPGASPALMTGPLGLGGAGAVETLDQIVPDRLELGHVRHVALGAEQGVRRFPGLSGVGRVRGELCLEVRDLAPELPAAEAFVALDTGRLGLGDARKLGLEVRARRVDGPREVPRVDPAFARALDRLGGQALEIRRAARVGGDEGPEPVPRGDQPFVLEPAIHRACGVDVDAGAARKLADPGQPVAGSELAARDQDAKSPGELRSQRKVVGTGQIRCEAGGGGLCLYLG
jgi:hypothetical protein